MTNIQFISTSSDEGYTAIKIAFERHPQMQKALIKYSKNHAPCGVWNLENIRAKELGNSSPTHFEEYWFQMGTLSSPLRPTACLFPCSEETSLLLRLLMKT